MNIHQKQMLHCIQDGRRMVISRKAGGIAMDMVYGWNTKMIAAPKLVVNEI
jgi:hypothetical protein